MRIRRPPPLVATCLIGALGLSGCVQTGDWHDGDSLLPTGSNEPPPATSRLPGWLGGSSARAEPVSASNFADIGYANWTDEEPPYRFYPGDEVEISVPSAPELNRTSVVQPDGRIALNLVQPVMAADRSAPQLQLALSEAYSNVLLRPSINVAAKTVTPIKVFVGGEVNNPGMYDLIGDGDSLRAIIQAGGFKTTAKVDRVVIIRRSPDGRPMMRTANMKASLRGAGGDLVPLRRFDIGFVPRSNVAEANLFVQQYFRDLSPVQFGFNYSLNNPWQQ